MSLVRAPTMGGEVIPQLRCRLSTLDNPGDPRMEFSGCGNASIVTVVEFARKSVVVDGLVTGYLEAGAGAPVVLLHGGEFGASAELGWEATIGALAAKFRVL